MESSTNHVIMWDWPADELWIWNRKIWRCIAALNTAFTRSHHNSHTTVSGETIGLTSDDALWLRLRRPLLLSQRCVVGVASPGTANLASMIIKQRHPYQSALNSGNTSQSATSGSPVITRIITVCRRLLDSINPEGGDDEFGWNERYYLRRLLFTILFAGPRVFCSSYNDAHARTY